jgi:methionyl aminopeptidase
VWKSHRSAIQLKTPAQIAKMREAGLLVADILQALAVAAQPGVTTADLDALAEERIRAAGAVPSFKGYHGFPATICTSVNEEIVHGIPVATKRLREGSVISIDCGAIMDGWHADAALTVGIGEISAEMSQLLSVCEDALWQGLAQARAGSRLSDISHAVERAVRSRGSYGIVEEYVGHGIGTEMHMPPSIPNYGPPGRGPLLREGMALAVEPMVTAGGRGTELLGDDWTVVTADGSWAAHFEHTIAITAGGPWVLTAADGGLARLGSRPAAAKLHELR